ncbi:MAG TPA: WecB/TagA/CpsF family glycosyltransferase [Terriglobales bacterium]|nr:WecB/TagA/CpsF family glycosyltransferase [Terriglobales bacterium]
MSQINSAIAEAISGGEKIVVANHNLHSVYLYHRDARMRAFYRQARHVHIDGMPLVLLGQVTGAPVQREHRITYADWIDPLMALARDHGWRVFYLGSRPGVGEQAARKLRRQYPGLVLETAQGYFDATPGSREDSAVLEKINAFQPEILIMGMGMPRQEHWVLEHRPQLSANVILNAGAAMDYVAGAVPTPPRWAGRCGLEWLFRMMAEPQRLWKRYLLEPWFLLPLLVRELARVPRFTRQ